MNSPINPMDNPTNSGDTIPWILITGATSGIGKDTIAPLIQAGYSIIATGRNSTALKELETLFSSKMVTIAADLFSIESTDGMLDFVEKHFESRPTHSLFAIFNNAGLAYSSPLECTPPDALREQLEINLHSVHRITQRLIPLLRKCQTTAAPRILFTGSVSGRYAFPLLGPYSISKFALKAYADALRVELRHVPIYITLLELGPVRTAIWERSKADSEARQALYTEQHGILPPVYQTGTSRLLSMVEKIDRKAVLPSKVSREIVKIMQSKNPRPYRMFFRDKFSITLMRILPTRLLDFIADKTLFTKKDNNS